MSDSIDAIKWEDSYYVSKDRVVLTNRQISVPGIRVLAHHLMTSAIPGLAAHYHENCFEFTVICDGAFTFQAHNKNYTVAGGDIFVAYPNEVHSTNSVPLSHGEFYWLQLDISSPEHFLFLEENAARDLILRLNNIQSHIVKIRDRNLLSLLKNAFFLSLNGDSPYLIASHLLLFLNQLATISTDTHTLSREIYNALNFIYDHIESDISIDDLAKCSMLSVPQFKVRFKQEVGISPRSFINMQKIELAKQMLLEGSSKTQIALSLGFNTSSYFSAVFKRYTFCTPSEYVKKHHS